ncbi:MAG: MBL fold metallo-hydrolase [Myxococcales bacterium]|nr:MBL fold metallo-hydrolase [Myxococcales bacterium]
MALEMALRDQELGPVTVLFGEEDGKYPDGNSLLVRGAEETLIIDPALGVRQRTSLARVDRLLNSHCHEDHVAGNSLFRDVPCHLHEADLPGMQSLEGFLAIFGYAGGFGDVWAKAIVEQFHYEPRPDAQPFSDGDVFDLGGGVRVHVIHTPGHTRGHCAFLVEPEGVLYLGDIDLSSFGPYYGDAWSDLEDFERSLARVREIDTRWYATFHHIGVLDGRSAFLERLDRFSAAIPRREARLLEFLTEPRTLDEVAIHRCVYRPGDHVPHAEPVERRSMSQHIERLMRAGLIIEVEPGRYRAAA